MRKQSPSSEHIRSRIYSGEHNTGAALDLDNERRRRRPLGNVAIEAVGTARGGVVQLEPSPFDDIVTPLEADFSHGSGVARVDETAPAGSLGAIDGTERVGRYESDRATKQAPRFDHQVADVGRINTLTYLAGFAGERRNMLVTEHEGLLQLDEFLVRAAESKYLDDEVRARAAEMRGALTFIGETEYAEAATGIATQWKRDLDAHPAMKIVAVTGEIEGASHRYEDDARYYKSDDYLLDRILAHFSDEELLHYRGRLLTEESLGDIAQTGDTQVVLLDDWTISGMQLLAARERLVQQHAALANCIEVQLIVASEERLRDGLVVRGAWGMPNSTLPVRAYYCAHNAKHTVTNGAYVTGSHSSVDFNFAYALSEMEKQMRAEDESVEMPALARIARPYRQEGTRLMHKQRLAQATGLEV